MRYVCISCGYIYDPETGDDLSDTPAGIAFKDLPEEWRCPICYVGKDQFDPLD